MMAVRDTELRSRLSKNINLSHDFLPFWKLLKALEKVFI